MKTLPTPRRATRRGKSVALAILLALGSTPGPGIAQVAAAASQDIEIQTRGPVHEAFASLVAFNPLPGILVTKLPPDPIEEVPPEYKPEGDNITWIPGYWGWDDERTDFIWISGIWRALPPNREWIAGYWSNASGQYQWTSGYWNNVRQKETVYLPPPPATLEAGPNIAAPAADYGWLPGSWLWHEDRYAWQPGYWDQGRSDWIWIPAHYVWTPRGHIYVEGYWDHPVARRGVLFAPVYYSRNIYAQPDYRYSPSVAINLSIFALDLFLRPRYNQYYFGDYYSDRYRSDGYYAPYAYRSDRHGYDPIHDYQRWEHRNDNQWEKSVKDRYQNRYDNASARPARSWSAMQRNMPAVADARARRDMIAESYENQVKSPDSHNRYKKLGDDDRKDITRHSRELRDFGKQRQELENKREANEPREANVLQKPIRVKAPRSPIAANSGHMKNGGAPPPKSQRAPTGVKPGKSSQQDPAKPREEVKRKPSGQPQQPRQVEQPKRPKEESAKPREEVKRKPSGQPQQPHQVEQPKRADEEATTKAREEALRKAKEKKNKGGQ